MISPEIQQNSERPTPEQLFKLASVCARALGSLNKNRLKDGMHYKIVEGYSLASDDVADENYAAYHSIDEPVLFRKRMAYLIKRHKGREEVPYAVNDQLRAAKIGKRAWDMVIFDVMASRYSSEHEGIARSVYRFSWDETNVHRADQRIEYNGYDTFAPIRDLSDSLDNFYVPEDLAATMSATLAIKDVTREQLDDLIIDMPKQINTTKDYITI